VTSNLVLLAGVDFSRLPADTKVSSDGSRLLGLTDDGILLPELQAFAGARSIAGWRAVGEVEPSPDQPAERKLAYWPDFIDLDRALSSKQADDLQVAKTGTYALATRAGHVVASFDSLKEAEAARNAYDVAKQAAPEPTIADELAAIREAMAQPTRAAVPEMGRKERPITPSDKRFTKGGKLVTAEALSGE
jgi:hypothetical protein